MKKIKVLAFASVVSVLAGCASHSDAPQEPVPLPPVVAPNVEVTDGIAPISPSDVSLSENSVNKDVIHLTPTETSETINQPHFAIQVLGLSQREAFNPLMASLPNNVPAWILDGELNGQPWYTLLVGDYISYEQAKAALATLPESVRQQGAFVKSFEQKNVTRVN